MRLRVAMHFCSPPIYGLGASHAERKRTRKRRYFLINLKLSKMVMTVLFRCAKMELFGARRARASAFRLLITKKDQTNKDADTGYI